MRIGFTGTRAGMTISQLETLEYLLLGLEFNEWHDGDCIGSDEQANRLVWSQVTNQGLQVQMHGHPCNLEKFRAYNEYDVIHNIKPPLVRNRDMVDSSDIYFATPKEYTEVFRGSGTWATIRYAKHVRRHLVIIWPDGTHVELT